MWKLNLNEAQKNTETIILKLVIDEFDKFLCLLNSL